MRARPPYLQIICTRIHPLSSWPRLIYSAPPLPLPLHPGRRRLASRRDYSFRSSAPVSPRRTPSTNSSDSAKAPGGDVFCTTYKDHVVAAADGKVGMKLRLPPLMDDASAAMESQVRAGCPLWLCCGYVPCPGVSRSTPRVRTLRYVSL